VAAEYRPSQAFAVAGGAALSAYGADGGIPDPTDLGVAYRAYVAPELSLEASDARAFAASLSALWAVLPGGSLWARVPRSSLGGSDAAFQLPLAPGGERTGWRVEVGVVVR
jgi:hypothetical protein